MSMTVEEAKSLVSATVPTGPSPSAATGEVTIDSIVDELNQEFALVKIGSKVRFLQEETNSDGQPDETYLSKPDFQTLMANRIYEYYTDKGIKRMGYDQVWLKSPQRREYKAVIFAPGQELDPAYYNTYRGFAVEPKPGGSWKKLRHHIFTNICRKNRKIYRYVMAWVAKLIQDPGGDRTGVVIVLRGRQGTGKGVLVNAIGKLLGTHYLHLTNQQQILGKFNRHLEKALLLFADESFFAGDKQAAGSLKGLITEPTFQVEPKGIDSYQARNYLHIIMASNNEWVVPAGHEERRFLVLDVDDKQMQNHQYFKEINEELENGGYEAMLHDLLRHKYANVNLRQAPSTAGLFDQKVATLESVPLFWFNALCTGTIRFRDDHGYMDEWDICKHFVPAENLFSAYKLFCSDQRENYPLPPAQFSKELKKLVPTSSAARKAVNGTKYRGYEFVSIESCRDHFVQLMGGEIDWTAWELRADSETTQPALKVIAPAAKKDPKAM